MWSFCRLLGLKQIDLVIIHAPYHGYGEPYSNCSKGPAGAAARRATWRGMEKAVKDGLTRTIGLSNFDVEYMNEIMEGAEIPPAVNQVGLASPLLSSTPLANHRQSARRRCSSSLGCLTTLAAMHGDHVHAVLPVCRLPAECLNCLREAAWDHIRGGTPMILVHTYLHSRRDPTTTISS